MSVFVGASVLEHISATAYQNFTKLPVSGRYAVLLWRHREDVGVSGVSGRLSRTACHALI